MLAEINGQLMFCYGCPQKKKINHFKYLGSLLVILIGVFLLPNVAYFSNITPEKIIELTNEQRLDSDLNQLSPNHLLTQAAYKKAQAIIDAQKFQHSIDDKKFSFWIKESGYKYSYTGENLAIDFVTSEGVIKAWLNSESHKKNLLNSHYEETGVAILENNFHNQNTILVVQIFGAPPKSVIQPHVMGVDNQNYLGAPANSPALASIYKAENLLTHSIYQTANNQLTSQNKNFPLHPIEKDSAYKVNNFFAHYNLLAAANFSNIFLSLFFLFLLFYIYFLSFLYIKKSV